ncbi:AAA family ATPase, partial [Escherichia marmotae]|nr:AAA family ATPase [Escherichia marmotae]HEI2704652.1 AAA family ATPase [Escherichia coli]
MNILPVVSTKGGEGKSTQSANLAGFLADAGLRTLLIDGDHAQPTASNIFPLAYEAPAGLFELLMRTADLSHPDNIISRTAIDGLDLIVSNDPHEQLKTAMLHAPDGRLRLRNVLQHPLFQSYDVIVVDSQGARSVMLEMIVLSATESVVGMVNPVLPDVREFIRGTVNVMENLLPYRELGIPLPKVRTLVNCMDYTALARQT